MTRDMVLYTRNDGHVPVKYQSRILTAAAKRPNVETRQMDTSSWIFVSPESSGLSYALEEYIRCSVIAIASCAYTSRIHDADPLAIPADQCTLNDAVNSIVVQKVHIHNHCSRVSYGGCPCYVSLCEALPWTLCYHGCFQPASLR